MSKKANEYLAANKLLDPIVAEANAKVLSWVRFNLDPLFESNELKADETGVYAQVMANLSYGEVDVDGAADMLIEGVNSVLGN